LNDLVTGARNMVGLDKSHTGARDMVGLDKSRNSFSSQVFHSLGTQKKITLCLSPTSGIQKTKFEGTIYKRIYKTEGLNV